MVENALSDNLFLGQCFSSKDEARARVTVFHTARRKQYIIHKSDSVRLMICCPCFEKDNPTSCQFYCSLAVKSEGEWKVVRLQDTHTCHGTDPNLRQRNPRSRDYDVAFPTISFFQPNKLGHNAEQLEKIAKQSNGVIIKRSQAHKIIARKKDRQLSHLIGQYMLLPSYFRILKQMDPGGTFTLDDTVCSWDVDKVQFKCCYVALSSMKAVWAKHGTFKLVVSDGTFTLDGQFKHTLFLAVTFDGNNELVVLAFAVADVENGENWM